MRTLILTALFSIACSASKPAVKEEGHSAKAEQQPEASAKLAEPERAPTTGEREGPIDMLVAEVLAYTEKMMVIGVGYDGDCDAFAQNMLTLEPMAKSVREGMAAMVKDGADSQVLASELNSRMKTEENKAVAEAKLLAMGTSMDEFNAAVEKFQGECAGNKSVADAMDRVGLFKKTAAPQGEAAK